MDKGPIEIIIGSIFGKAITNLKIPPGLLGKEVIV